jgi:excisionase family DNA binding protein
MCHAVPLSSDPASLLGVFYYKEELMENEIVAAMDLVSGATQEAQGSLSTALEEFFTVEEAAPKVRMSTQSLYAACREKQFPHVKIGKRVRIPASALTLWIERQLRKQEAA